MSSVLWISSRVDLDPEPGRHLLDLVHFERHVWNVDVAHHRDASQSRHDLAEKLQPVAGKIGLLVRQTSDVTARPRQACDDPGADRIAGRGEHDRDVLGRLHDGESRPSARCDDDVHAASDELGGVLGVAFVAALRPAILDRHVTAVDPAELTQTTEKRRDERAPHRRRRRAEKSDRRQPPLPLRKGGCRKRQRSRTPRRAAQRTCAGSSHQTAVWLRITGAPLSRPTPHSRRCLGNSTHRACYSIAPGPSPDHRRLETPGDLDAQRRGGAAVDDQFVRRA